MTVHRACESRGIIVSTALPTPRAAAQLPESQTPVAEHAQKDEIRLDELK